MPLTTEEILTAKRMYDFVQVHERNLQIHPLLRWGGPLGLGFASFFQIIGGHSYGYATLAGAVLIVILGHALQRERNLRYQDEIVILQALVRDHPGDLSWLPMESMESRTKPVPI